MKQFGRIALIVLSLGGLAAALSSVPTRPAGAATTADETVKVVNTPLPVQGTVGVSNFPAIQAVSGTVNIGTLPAVNVSFPSSLNVGNIATTETGGVPNILLIRNVDDTALQPFQQQATVSFTDGSFVGNLTSGPITVASGTRLILDYVAANASVPTGNRFTVQLATFQNSNLTGQEIASTGAVTIGSSDIATLSQPLHIYADGPSGILLGGSRSYSSGALQVTVLLSGHVVNIP